MPDYRIIIDIKDVTDGDVNDVAQQIYDEHAESLDAKLGDFIMQVNVVQGSTEFVTDWVPEVE